MKNITRNVISLSLVFILLFCSAVPGLASAEAVKAPNTFDDGLSTVQRNAIIMLNYLVVLTQEINSNPNDPLLLESAYNQLRSDLYPNSIDQETQYHITFLLDTLEHYRMLEVRRDRLARANSRDQLSLLLDVLFDENGLFGDITVGTLIDASQGNPLVLLTDINFGAVYNLARGNTDQAELEALWALDDEAAEALHKCHVEEFDYLLNIVRSYKLPGDVALNEKLVNEFVSWKNNPNAPSRIQYLESHRGEYRYYTGYWFVLAESYYEVGDYENCLLAVQSYEDLNIRIFRKDYDYAQVLPLAIASAEKTLSPDAYIHFADEHVQYLVDNTDEQNWALRYFAALTCMDLFERTGKAAYLDAAYTLALNGANYYAREQRSLNEAYLNDIQEISVRDSATQREKDEISAYNKQMKEARKTELPPVSEPLVLNLELLLSLADLREFSDADRAHLDKMFRNENGQAPLFLVDSLDARYRFGESKPLAMHNADELVFSGDTLEIPAAFLTSDAVITVSVYTPEEENPVLITDWVVDKVSRSDDGLSAFTAKYSSEAGDDFSWEPGMRVVIDIKPCKGVDVHNEFVFNVKSTDKSFYEVWKDSLEFVPENGSLLNFANGSLNP